VFGHILGPRSFDSLEGPLARKQASLPMAFDGIMLILTSNIALSPPFEQFNKQQMVQLQDSILEHLQHHTLSNML
jgi:hypothetical protein